MIHPNIEKYRQSPKGGLEQARLNLSMAKAKFEASRVTLRRAKSGPESREAWRQFEKAEKVFDKAIINLARIKQELKGGGQNGGN